MTHTANDVPHATTEDDGQRAVLGEMKYAADHFHPDHTRICRPCITSQVTDVMTKQSERRSRLCK